LPELSATEKTFEIAPEKPGREGALFKGLRSVAFGLFVVSLALAPFPLGSNRGWSWSLLSLLVALSWILWSLSIWPKSQATETFAKGLIPPIVLAATALLWGFVQTAAFMPEQWAHPVWAMTSFMNGRKSGAISIAPWHTATELMKLASYAMAAWLARVFSERGDDAARLLDWLIVIGTLYALYGFVLVFLGRSQFELFYGMPATRVARDLAGPFVNHNSYATYVGLIALCAGVRLVNGAWAQANFQTDLKGSFLAIQYIFGRGVLWLVATLLNLSALIATGSRGGNLATLMALMTMAIFGILLASRVQRPVQITAYLAVFASAVGSLFAINGARLLSHLDDLPTGNANFRFLLGDAAWRMVRDAPFTGLGLGAYQAAYPYYARVAVPFVIDKAHNDYLELAAGWGLPAALCWWAALLWLAGLCLRGIFTRRRNRVFPLLALGAVVLVGIHAIFDFSLQIPAVALTFAAILGLGVAQAFPTRIVESENP